MTKCPFISSDLTRPSTFIALHILT